MRSKSDLNIYQRNWQMLTHHQLSCDISLCASRWRAHHQPSTRCPSHPAHAILRYRPPLLQVLIIDSDTIIVAHPQPLAYYPHTIVVRLLHWLHCDAPMLCGASRTAVAAVSSRSVKMIVLLSMQMHGFQCLSGNGIYIHIRYRLNK